MIAVVLGSILVLVAAASFFGALLHRVPYLGLGSAVVMLIPVWLLLFALAGTALMTWAWTRRGSRYRAAVAMFGAATFVTGAIEVNQIIHAVEQAGADISLTRTFLRPGWIATASPDAEPTYLTDQGEDLKLSIFKPGTPGGGRAAPILVHIHGGGWVTGSRTARNDEMRWFADQGYLVASVDYSLSTAERHLWDVVQAQIGCAMSWVASHAAEYGGDATRIALIGESAGGNLAINTAYLAARETLPSTCGGTAPRVGAVVGVVPAVDPAAMARNEYPLIGPWIAGMVRTYAGGSPEQFPERYARIASASHISPKAPPTLLIWGGADHLIAGDQVLRFAGAAERAGITVKRVYVPHVDHRFGNPGGSLTGQACRQLTVRWLEAHGTFRAASAAPAGRTTDRRRPKG